MRPFHRYFARYEEGECWTTRLPDGSIRVDRADPRILISAEFIDEIRAGNHHPDVRLDGDLLHIDADNENVIYRIGDKHPTQDAYCAEWPD